MGWQTQHPSPSTAQVSQQRGAQKRWLEPPLMRIGRRSVNAWDGPSTCRSGGIVGLSLGPLTLFTSLSGKVSLTEIAKIQHLYIRISFQIVGAFNWGSAIFHVNQNLADTLRTCQYDPELADKAEQKAFVIVLPGTNFNLRCTCSYTISSTILEQNLPLIDFTALLLTCSSI